MIRYFRSAVAIYVSVCAQLDNSYGYPNEQTKTQRTLPPTSELPTDNGGRVYLSVNSEYCEFVLPSQILPGLIASGAVEELTEQQWREMFPPSMP